MRIGSPGPGTNAGFTYIGLLIFVAMLGAAATASLGAGASLLQRGAEAELLAIGLEYRAALKSYAEATPFGQPDAPKELTELLRDPRYPGVRRHLRRLYPDPLTGRTEWGVLRDPGGRILGIHSLSTTATLRQAEFPLGLESFKEARRHDEWVFALVPQATSATNAGGIGTPR
ncbi:type II secretion system protein [Sulfurisoma sediminicola]|uniref:Type II secretory pathway pseudopilin PulG n=1 Tax=Sulfurisoma sediminicola TaxID=1381557 RepID=A0A497XAF8_9PROT|nr:type II secretion system protein [Sulfurisoma sediminicola]RLJ63516.1 type II secretory pathway pseudopilin PulG [Sulfurisoma sediminicola]